MMMPGPGGAPGAPGGAPSGGPPGAPPPGMMPPPQPGPPGLPSGAPVGGPSPASPTPFTDLSDKLPHHYQLLDVAASTIEQAINTGGFYKEPKVLAGIRSVHAQLATLIANGSKGSGFGAVPEGPSLTPSAGSDGPDDDEQPEEETSDEM